MKADQVRTYIVERFPDLMVAENFGDIFFIYDPHGDLPPKRQMPFATIVVGDTYDSTSALATDGAFRLNIGLTKDTYLSLFGPVPTIRDENGVYATDYDYTVRDQLMPHPIYAGQHWACVVAPGVETFEALTPLLAEAYGFAARKDANWRARGRSGATGDNSGAVDGDPESR
ncbi:hypothetical protein D5S18_13035 [Nocardia panacis]|uniref:DUF6194 domain-containing protein n=1 Tax=Nocardia panacis TaxID=2340916 RepID=A0A3A4KB34_9NOCA|nr:DUF6194 family protein [Nocardia panacis]RJO77090.1 hypothetical protein D5S18_13035 [Nocardia panacis]